MIEFLKAHAHQATYVNTIVALIVAIILAVLLFKADKEEAYKMLWVTFTLYVLLPSVWNFIKFLVIYFSKGA